MHFFYVQSNILCKWLNILSKFYVTVLTGNPEYSLLWRSIPLQPPCPPSDPAHHPTLPDTLPCPPQHPASQWQPPHHVGLPSQTALPASSATTASGALRRASAILVLLQRLCVGSASQCETLSNILHTPSNFLHNPSKFYKPHLILYVIPLIFYVSLSCDAVDTQSAQTLPGACPRALGMGLRYVISVTKNEAKNEAGWQWMLSKLHCLTF